MLGPLKKKGLDHTCGYCRHFLSIYFRTSETQPTKKENHANNLRDLDLKYKTQSNNVLISVTNTYAESVLFMFIYPALTELGKGSKTPGTETFRGGEGGGGYPLFPLTFREPTVRGGGRGVPPFPLRKHTLKIGTKTVFLGKNRRFRKRIVR